MNPAWVSAVCALVCALAALVYWFARVMWKMFQKTDAFLEDWNGSADSPGHPHRPGVMERLVQLETDNSRFTARLDKQDESLAVIRSEVTYNSGHSIKDIVRDVLARVDKFDPPARKI